MSFFSDTTKIKNFELELSTKDYSAVEFINSVIPDSSSLNSLGELSKTIHIRFIKNDKAITDDVRKHSIDQNISSTGLLSETQNSVKNLSKRIDKIREESNETERTIKKICKDIEPLDRAKNNLNTTVTTLRRLQMMSTTIASLERNIQLKNYSECAPNVLALTSLVEDFKRFQNAPQLSPLISKFFDLKRQLRNQVNSELDQRLFGGTADASNLAVCAVVDSFADDFRSSTIDWFCEKFLSCYDDAFAGTDLSEVQNRYRWFKQRLTIYNNNYACAFPLEWRMQYWITLSFAQRTCWQFKDILAKAKPNPKQYLQAFEMTVKFEQKMSESFSIIEEVPFDPDAPIPSFPDTAEGVREKHEYMQRIREKRGTTRRVLATKFIGSIATAFAPYMQIYINSERETLLTIINEAQANIKGDIDQDEKVLNSSRSLIIAMKKSLDKCAGFGVDKTLIDLFHTIKNLIVQYVSGLSRLLPKKTSSEESYQLMCCIANTSSMILSILDSLATKVSGIVNEKMQANISVEDTKNAVSEELKKQIIFISDSFVHETESYFISIGNNSWTGGDRLPTKLIDAFDSRFSIVSEWLESMNINRLRSTLTQKIVSVIRDSLFRTRGITVESASRVFMSLKDVKETLAYWTKSDSPSARRRLEFDFARLENDLTILCCPEIAMTVTYLGKTQTKSKEHFMSLVKLRGLSQQVEAQISQEYDQQLPLFADK